MKRLSGLAFAVLALAVLGGFAQNMGEARRIRAYGAHTLRFTLDDTRVNESSGLAPSRSVPGTYYTHNDSGDSARFFRFQSGNVTNVIRLHGAGAFDWEDMESARVDGRDYLYIGDIGDNAAVRPYVTIYRCEEPGSGVNDVPTYERYDVTYPNGARDAEGLIVDPGTGDIYIVSKQGASQPSHVYRIPKPQSPGAYVAQHLGTIVLPVSQGKSTRVTGASAAPDGKWVVVRTLHEAFEYAVPPTFSVWVSVPPNKIALRTEQQGEAICYSLDGRTILTSSEGTPCPISALPVR